MNKYYGNGCVENAGGVHGMGLYIVQDNGDMVRMIRLAAIRCFRKMSELTRYMVFPASVEYGMDEMPGSMSVAQIMEFNRPLPASERK